MAGHGAAGVAGLAGDARTRLAQPVRPPQPVSWRACADDGSHCLRHAGPLAYTPLSVPSAIGLLERTPRAGNTDPMTAAFINAYHDDKAHVAPCTATRRRRCVALAGHQSRSLRVHPGPWSRSSIGAQRHLPRRAGTRSPQSRHDRKARASLEIARLCASVEDVALFGRRAISLVDSMGPYIPSMLEPGWQALSVAHPPAVN